MKLMWKDEVIADSIQVDGKYYLKLRENIPKIKVPFALFRSSDTEDLFYVMNWSKKRVFPEERFGADELLKELGLDKYDAWSIVKKTGGALTCVDNFWLDFEDENCNLYQRANSYKPYGERIYGDY